MTVKEVSAHCDDLLVDLFTRLERLCDTTTSSLDLGCVRAKSVRCGSIDERREQDEPDLTIQLARAVFRLVDIHVRCNHKGIFQPQPAPTCDCIRDSPSQQQRRDNCQRYSHPLQILPLSFVRGKDHRG